MSDNVYTLKQKCLAEAMGTFIIIGGGCGFVCANRYANWPVGPLGGPAVFTLAVVTAIYSFREVSGAHFNPAVTASLALNRPWACPQEKGWIQGYLGAQMAGATLAAGINYCFFKNGIKELELKNSIKRGAQGSCWSFNGAFGMVPDRRLFNKSWMVFLMEVGFTAGLLFSVFAVTDPAKDIPHAIQPALIGLIIMTIASQYSAPTGCGMNPVRDLGPRLITSMAGWGRACFSFGWWAYSAGPVTGAVLGGALYNFCFEKKHKNPPIKTIEMKGFENGQIPL